MAFSILTRIMMLVGVWLLTMLAIEVAMPTMPPADALGALEAFRENEDHVSEGYPGLLTEALAINLSETTTMMNLMVPRLSLGAAVAEEVLYTYDCWKPILRETDPTPSKGRLLVDVIQDPRVRRVEVYNHEPETFSMEIENVWGERFHVGPVFMPDGSIFGHAVRV
jgi:hypothetical protein